MSDEQSTGTPRETPTPAIIARHAAERTFTQAEVNRLVGAARQDERRKTTVDKSTSDSSDQQREQPGDATSARITELEQQLRDSELRALRMEIAHTYGLQGDDQVFLNELTNAEDMHRLGARLAEIQNKRERSGIVRSEGGNRTRKGNDDTMRDFVNELIGNDS